MTSGIAFLLCLGVFTGVLAIFVGFLSKMLWPSAEAIVRFQLGLLPPGDIRGSGGADGRLARRARADFFVELVRDEAEKRRLNHEPGGLRRAIFLAIVGTAFMVVRQWWHYNRVIVAGAIEFTGSLTLGIGGTIVFGWLMGVTEAILILAVANGVLGYAFRKKVPLTVAAVLLIGEGLMSYIFEPMSLDNALGYGAVVFWVVGIATIISAIKTRSYGVDRLGSILLAAGMALDAGSCLVDVPHFLSALGFSQPMDWITWLDMAPLPGLALLVYVLVRSDPGSSSGSSPLAGDPSDGTALERAA